MMIDIAEWPEDGLLRSALRGICPADEEAAARCRARWNRIAKPLYGLGVLEDLVVRIAAAQGRTTPHQMPPPMETVPRTTRSTADAAMQKAMSQTQGCFPVT